MFVKIIPKLASFTDTHKRYGRGTNGTISLRSYDDRNNTRTGGAETSKMEIKVHQSIEMKTLPVDDDDSEKNLVTTSWMADCYSNGNDSLKPGHAHTAANGNRSAKNSAKAANSSQETV
jgi:hypothetical protein